MIEKVYSPIFQNPENGTASSPTKRGFVALAKLGSDAWNSWSHDFSDVVVDFSGLTLQQDECTFSKFQFRSKTNFSAVRFLAHTRFHEATFLREVTFEDAVFAKGVHFSFAELQGISSFSRARFEQGARFVATAFGARPPNPFGRPGVVTDFSECHCSGNGNMEFQYSHFYFPPNFDRAVFDSGTSTMFNLALLVDPSFRGASFGWKTEFDGTMFIGHADFSGAEFSRLLMRATAVDAIPDWWIGSFGRPPEIVKETAAYFNTTPQKIEQISFPGVKFGGEANFDGREFLGTTDFGPLADEMSVMRRIKSSDDNAAYEKILLPAGTCVTFSSVPRFHDCKMHPDTRFVGTEFPRSPRKLKHDPGAITAYRTLKAAMKSIHAAQDELRFSRLEIAEERFTATGIRRHLLDLYGNVSDYGFSISKPFVWLIVVPAIVFMILYGLVFVSAASERTFLVFADHLDVDGTISIVKYSLMQSLPIVGTDRWSDQVRKEVFEGSSGLGQLVLYVCVGIQRTLSLAGIFLIGLAIRNFFKLKT